MFSSIYTGWYKNDVNGNDSDISQDLFKSTSSNDTHEVVFVSKENSVNIKNVSNYF